MADVPNILKKLSAAPTEAAAYDNWLEMKEVTAFLKENAKHDEFVVYATLRTVFIHALLVPSSAITPPDYEDLLAWNSNAYSGWGVVVAFHPKSVSLASPLSHTASKTLDKGEQLIFAREFEGRMGDKQYYEVLQKFSQVSDIHFLHERQAYCRLDEHGDVEDVVRIIEFSDSTGGSGGTVITCKREPIDQYAALTDSVIVRTFDFTFCDLSRFGGWTDGHKVEHNREKELFFYSHVEKGRGAFRRGCQIVFPITTKETLFEHFGPGTKRNQQYATFIAHDWKHDVVKEFSCSPEELGNYFVESDLPFETTPAFFRPEVLLKYKADAEKYSISERSITCRGAWHLQSYDISEAGQVHTYLVYLKNLPYQEQLYWKSFNEAPKGPISKRAFNTDFAGCWHTEYEPLVSLKAAVRDLRKQPTGWWQLKSDKLLEQLQYPATASPDEWANDLLLLDQLVVEGLQSRWLRNKASELGRNPDSKSGSIKLTEECLLGVGFEEHEAKRIVAPLRTTQELRTKLKGHAPGGDALKIRKEAIETYGSFRNHFRALCGQLDESVRRLTSAFKFE